MQAALVAQIEQIATLKQALQDRAMAAEARVKELEARVRELPRDTSVAFIQLQGERDELPRLAREAVDEGQARASKSTGRKVHLPALTPAMAQLRGYLAVLEERDRPELERIDALLRQQVATPATPPAPGLLEAVVEALSKARTALDAERWRPRPAQARIEKWTLLVTVLEPLAAYGAAKSPKKP